MLMMNAIKLKELIKTARPNMTDSSINTYVQSIKRLNPALYIPLPRISNSLNSSIAKYFSFNCFKLACSEISSNDETARSNLTKSLEIFLTA